jgi:hypothetical protein
MVWTSCLAGVGMPRVWQLNLWHKEGRPAQNSLRSFPAHDDLVTLTEWIIFNKIRAWYLVKDLSWERQVQGGKAFRPAIDREHTLCRASSSLHTNYMSDDIKTVHGFLCHRRCGSVRSMGKSQRAIDKRVHCGMFSGFGPCSKKAWCLLADCVDTLRIIRLQLAIRTIISNAQEREELISAVRRQWISTRCEHLEESTPVQSFILSLDMKPCWHAAMKSI